MGPKIKKLVKALLIILFVFISVRVEKFAHPYFPTFIGTFITILVFFTSSYYTIQKSDLQNMYNAFCQARINGNLAQSHLKKDDAQKLYYNQIAKMWFRNGNKWGFYYTIDCYCWAHLLSSTLSIFVALILYLLFNSSCHIFSTIIFFIIFTIATYLLTVPISIRLGWLDFRQIFDSYRKLNVKIILYSKW